MPSSRRVESPHAIWIIASLVPRPLDYGLPIAMLPRLSGRGSLRTQGCLAEVSCEPQGPKSKDHVHIPQASGSCEAPVRLL